MPRERGEDDPAIARDAVGFFLQAESRSALVGQSKYGEEVRARLAALNTGEELVVKDHWVEEFAVAGDAATVAARLQELRGAGADSLGLWLFPPSP